MSEASLTRAEVWGAEGICLCVQEVQLGGMSKGSNSVNIHARTTAKQEFDTTHTRVTADGSKTLYLCIRTSKPLITRAPPPRQAAGP